LSTLSTPAFKKIKHELMMEVGADAQKIKMAAYTAEDIILKTYLHTDNDAAKELLNRYEKLLVMCKVNYEAYKKHRRSAHLEIVKFIEENQLRRQWVELCHLLIGNINNSTALNALVSEMMETWMTFTWEKDTFCMGLSKDNTEWYEEPQYYGDYDDGIYKMLSDFRSHRMSEKKFLAQQENLSHEIFLIQRNEQYYTVASFHMVALINNRTRCILPKTWISHYEDNMPTLRQYKTTDYYKEMLQHRKYLIDRKGVTVHLKNANIYDEVLFMEDLTYDGRTVMLYKLTTEFDESTMGYFLPDTGEFFTAYKYVGEDPSSHLAMENFILELYTDLTCDLPKENKRLYSLKETADFDDPNLNRTNIYVQYQVYTPPAEGTGRKRRGGKQKSHERIYTTRKLREGMKASEEALERAKEYGIEVPDGETFVRPYWVGINQVRKELKV
jgi:hypothetical protein